MTSVQPENDLERAGPRILKRDRGETFHQIATDFNSVASINGIERTVQWIIIDLGFWSKKTTCIPLLTAQYKNFMPRLDPPTSSLDYR